MSEFVLKQKSKLPVILGGAGLLIFTIATLVAVTQLDKIRQFFGQAAGEEANIVVFTQNITGAISRPWRHLAQGGEEANWRLEPLQAQVATLKPAYIRVDHIYDFYEIVQGSPGNLSFDFSKFDLLLNDILATGAKPYIALSYMPPAISAGDIVALPQNWNDWSLTVQKTVEHVSGTRGINDVYYEVWNEPDLFGGFKYYGDKSYLTLYSYAVAGANRAGGVKPFKIGGPAITALYKNWFDALARAAVQNNLRLDFFSWHRYNHDVDQYRKDMADVQNWLQKYPSLANIELHITEWGHDSNNHPGYDNNYGAAHTVAGAIEMVGVVDKAFVFEIQDGKDATDKPYWGRWGLFTHQSAGAKPKPRYWALRMLDRIGLQRLQLFGKGSWVKALAALSTEGNPQVVLANYDQAGKHSELVPVTFQDIIPGNYVVKKEFLSGQKSQENVATTSTALPITVPMTANSVGFVELIKQEN